MDANMDSSWEPTVEDLLKADVATRLKMLTRLDEETRNELIDALPDDALAELAAYGSWLREHERKNDQEINKLANLLLNDMLSVKPLVRYLMWKNLKNADLKQWLLDQMPMRAIAEMWSAGRDQE